jgi:hypothetical protein
MRIQVGMAGEGGKLLDLEDFRRAAGKGGGVGLASVVRRCEARGDGEKQEKEGLVCEQHLFDSRSVPGVDMKIRWACSGMTPR